jgi:glycosyltransferase involved in cell wall biosynthesis
MNVLHIIPRWIGGGPERHLIELARQDKLQGLAINRRVIVLDRPISAPLLVAARKFGMTIVSQRWGDALDHEFEEIDIVDVTYWNHPLISQLLSRSLPECRVVFQVAVAGNTLPQIVSPELTTYADAWVLSAPNGFGASHLENQHSLVENIPAIADMSRLDKYQSKTHEGVRASYLGSLAPTKLHAGLPNIIAQVDRSVRFDLFGDADTFTIQQLSSRLELYEVADRVFVHGHVEDIAEALSETDIFVHPLNPHSYATSEKSLQEAMWLGLPPVMLTGTAADGWLEHGVNGYLASDETSFAEIVNDLAFNTLTRRSIGLAAQSYARKHFDPQKNARRIYEVYQKTMSVPKRAREPLFAKATTGSQIFLRTLGLTLHELRQQVKNHDSKSRFQLLRSEGGVLHYLKHYPDDVELTELAVELQ